MKEIKVFFIKRNDAGQILEVQANQDKNHMEYLKSDNPELQIFLSKIGESNKTRESLSGSDAEMIRVIDDLILLLIKKQIFVFTELPEAVQSKLNNRIKMRVEISPLDDLINDCDDIF